MLSPYVIGCTARDVYTWRWRYLSLCEQEGNQSTLPVHGSVNFTLSECCCVQPDGWFTNGQIADCRVFQPGGWVWVGWNVSVCSVALNV